MNREPSTESLTRADLVRYLESGCKPPDRWLIGVEHEKFLVTSQDYSPAPYEGGRSIHALLTALQAEGWAPMTEQDALIGLERGAAHVSLEPAGQLELATTPAGDVHQLQEQHTAHLNELYQATQALGLKMLGLGFQPVARREDLPWMPKGRYRIMREYMPTRGELGLDMMTRTATIQVSLDYADEADMVRKLRAGLALQPVVTALFANSPFMEGKPSGWLSYRSHVWSDTDPDRTGLLPWVFEEGMGFERYADYALDTPMYSVTRDGRQVNAAGQSFRDFLKGQLPALPGEYPTQKDWEDHLRSLFPEVRIKHAMEMRGADTGPIEWVSALSALWMGLLYDSDSLQAVLDLTHAWTAEEREGLRRDAARLGFKAEIKGRGLRELVLELLQLAAAGLHQRGCVGPDGGDESTFLQPLQEMAESGRTRADWLLQQYEGAWQGSVRPAIKASLL